MWRHLFALLTFSVHLGIFFPPVCSLGPQLQSYEGPYEKLGRSLSWGPVSCFYDEGTALSCRITTPSVLLAVASSLRARICSTSELTCVQPHRIRMCFTMFLAVASPHYARLCSTTVLAFGPQCSTHIRSGTRLPVAPPRCTCICHITTSAVATPGCVRTTSQSEIHSSSPYSAPCCCGGRLHGLFTNISLHNLYHGRWTRAISRLLLLSRFPGLYVVRNVGRNKPV